jgi:hypothetical protein
MTSEVPLSVLVCQAGDADPRWVVSQSWRAPSAHTRIPQKVIPTKAHNPQPRHNRVMKFQTVLIQQGKTATGIEVPDDVIAALAAGKRFPVTVTIGDYSYRSTLTPYKGKNLISMSAENRAGAGVEGGQQIEVDVVVDTEPRVVEIPVELRAAIDSDSDAATFFETLSVSAQRAYVAWVESAKQETTRATRLEKTVEYLREKRKQP